MPKISAASVREHRARRLDQLIDAAEAIIAEHGVHALTAGAVAARVGLARNSIYRYFNSIEDLIELVVTREYPVWMETVRAAVDAAPTPAARVIAYVRSNLELAAQGRHGWRAAIAQSALPESSLKRIGTLHASLTAMVTEAVAELGVEQPRVLEAVLHTLVEASIRQIDAGDDPAAVIAFACATAERLLPAQG
ncbi:MAG TPA: TetR/AcrR family transcriptional regulator [Micromonospora sp.]